MDELLVTDLSTLEVIWCLMIIRLNLGTGEEVIVVGLKALFWYWPGGTEVNHKTTQLG